MFKMILNYFKKILLLCIFASLLLSAIPAAHSQPAGNRAIENTEVSQQNDCSVITVTFVFPVQFLSNFPRESGKELRVQFRPLVVGQSNITNVFSNEVVRLMDNVNVSITRFEFAGEFFPNNPYLWLTFSDTVYFNVEQGSDFRSLVLYLSPNPIKNCE